MKEELEQKKIIDFDLGSNTRRGPGRAINFETGTNTICRPPRVVMQHFAAHASHCPHCADPFRVYVKGGTLCERGLAYARDVAQYIYSKDGEAYSVIDRESSDLKVQIEIPPCNAVRGLLKAVDKGLKVRS